MTPKLFSTDLDGTLLGNPEATARFRLAWEARPPVDRPLLVYNSGRMIEDMMELMAEKILPPADYLIAAVGTRIFNVTTGHALGEFEITLDEGWALDVIENLVSRLPGVEAQPPALLNPHKSSWFLHHAPPEVLLRLQQDLADAGLDVQVVYSGHRFLDILPKNANKGSALAWLCRHLSVPHHDVLVAGDSANDTHMFQLEGVRGIVVENSEPRLLDAVLGQEVYHAEQVMADGVLAGLRHFGICLGTESAASRVATAPNLTPDMRMLFESGSLKSLRAEEIALIEEGYQRAVEALRRNITPLGYSACSLTDNEVTGTDENYRSVWARDGAITLIYSLAVELPPEFRAAERATLETLLSRLSPNGQIPSNVRIDTGEADYSGVGGIASIDSGLWVIIAVWNFVRRTGDVEFLRRHFPGLQRAMDWLGAHDSNNDGLLEIPEAGDWTDLFGRSYNVLYDEVLWCRANVCFAHLLETLGESVRASEYLQRSQHIRGEILANFWPSTAQRAGGNQAHHFADQQFSLGDAQYLIAQVSPFGFNWRCDVFGNILAFLCNVLDVDRAKTAFKFLWGVGANAPFPVVNLYPPVQAGDPDWRSYYTVNLLNLPNHYHNGGVWPFIGGMWVRFLHRLGLGDIAAHELVRLAELNRLGRDSPWEFNEWAHGVTGRPMGKRFQAWSAASYIRACRELQIGAPDPEHD